MGAEGRHLMVELAALAALVAAILSYVGSARDGSRPRVPPKVVSGDDSFGRQCSLPELDTEIQLAHRMAITRSRLGGFLILFSFILAVIIPAGAYTGLLARPMIGFLAALATLATLVNLRFRIASQGKRESGYEVRLASVYRQIEARILAIPDDVEEKIRKEIANECRRLANDEIDIIKRDRQGLMARRHL